MKVPRSQLVPILAKLSQKLPPKKFTTEMANYLLSENRIGDLDRLARDLINYRAENGVVEITAVSARPLATDVLNEAKQKVKQLYPAARQIIINQQIDDDQIGGVRLEMPGKQLDLSVRNKLNQLKQLTAGK